MGLTVEVEAADVCAVIGLLRALVATPLGPLFAVLTEDISPGLFEAVDRLAIACVAGEFAARLDELPTADEPPSGATDGT